MEQNEGLARAGDVRGKSRDLRRRYPMRFTVHCSPFTGHEVAGIIPMPDRFVTWPVRW